MKASADAAVMAMRTDRESLIRAVLSTVIASAVSGSGVHDRPRLRRQIRRDRSLRFL